MARKPIFTMSVQARPGDKLIDGWPVTCSRTQYLEDKDAQRATDNEYAQCRRISRRPGFEKMAKMNYNK